ncbi:MFS transporter [Paenibacillus sp. V4I5]|uniref:MFS transporter n=1 Tax=Paenibacillus sp. V4I5 TaxID=3042306 RepID=UPI00278D16EB|nr:MFS transporter [Paenibacillus sp. V4I5]MDQ0920581.1 DHA3 family macrolide efflux protein-like MFS transporter [Paenibacillus sp. V4I5]
MKQQNWKRSFFTIWAGQAVSLITSSVLQMAIIWYLTDTTGSAMVLSMATMVGFLPQAILGTMIGVLVDRWNRKLIMIGADLIIAAAGAALAVVAITIDLPIWVVMIVLFIRSIGTAFHTPALSAVTPLLVPEDQLTKCAGYSQSVQSVSYILSPAIGAFLYATWELNAIIAIDVLGALIACITVAMVVIPKQMTQGESVKSNFFEEAIEGYRTFRESKGLFALLWIGALYAFVFMPINALFPLMSMSYFGGTATHASIVEIVFAVGMLVGGLLLGVWGGLKNRALSIIFSISLMGITLFISGLLPINGFLIFVLCSAMMGFSSPFYSGVQMALIQEKIQPEYLGRVFGLLGSITSFAIPIGLIVSGIFADRIGINTWFMLSGVCIIAIALLCVLLPSIRHLDK